jgi:phage/plasmid-like protein (TIGR03299 family)
VSSASNASAALAAAGLLDWEVRTRPIFTTGPDGTPIGVRDLRATVRRNPEAETESFDALGVVGREYQVIQNEEAFEFLTKLVAAGYAMFETAGSLDGGARVFVTMRVPEHVLVAGQDPIALYVAVTTSHDGRSAFTSITTPVRIECQNTLKLALSKAEKRYVKPHRGTRALSVDDARAELGLVVDEGAQIAKIAEGMLRRRVSVDAFDAIVAREFAPIRPGSTPAVATKREKQRDAMRWLYRDGPHQEFGRGTAWAAFNAIAEWLEWYRQSNPSAPSVVESVLVGDIADLRQKAWRVFSLLG